MANFSYGPIDIYVVEFEGAGIAPGVRDALLELSGSGAVRVVDLVVATRDADGNVQVSEARDAGGAGGGEFDELDFNLDVELEIEGLISTADIEEVMADIEPGHGVAIAALEMQWAVELSSSLAAAKGVVVRTERISAPDVNALIAQALDADALDADALDADALREGN